jgi:hypothetical protein
MNRFKTAVGVFLIFACGIAAGTTGTFYYFNLRIDRLTASVPPVTHLLIRPDILRQLDLSDVQHEKIMAVCTRIEKDIQAFRQAYHPELIDIIDSGLLEINELLTPDQQTRFTRIHAKMKHRWEKSRCSSGRSSWRSPRLLSLEFLIHRFDLDAEQIEKIGPALNPLLTEYRRIIHENQYRRQPPGHSVHAEIRAIEQEAVDLILPLLNPDQQQIMRSMNSASKTSRRFRTQDD